MAGFFFLCMIGMGVALVVIWDRVQTVRNVQKKMEERMVRLDWQINQLTKRVGPAAEPETAAQQAASPPPPVEQAVPEPPSGKVVEAPVPVAPVQPQPVPGQARLVERPAETVVTPAEQDTPVDPIFPEALIGTAEQSATVSKPETQPTPAPKPVPAQTATAQAPQRQWQESKWSKLEKQFVDNWTGILGAVILVMGVGFIGIYAVLKVNPFIRFLIVIGFAAGLYALYDRMRHSENWMKLGLWLRSASAAIFLFACMGAGGIPGLQFIQNPLVALVILGVGIVANIGLAYTGGKQMFATLHVVLAMVALFISPATLVTLLIATAVIGAGVHITYRERWEYHLFITLSLFMGYQLVWLLLMVDTPDFRTMVYIQKACALAVFILAAMNHYRTDYKTSRIEPIPLFTHLANWGYVGVALMLFSSFEPWKTAAIFAATIAAFVLARRGRALGIRWLYVTDTLISGLMGIIGFLSLSYFDLSATLIAAMIYIYCLMFTLVMEKEREIDLANTFFAVAALAGLVYLVLALFNLPTGGEMEMLKMAGLHAGVLAITLGMVFYSDVPNSPWSHLASLASPTILILIYLCVRELIYAEAVFAVLFLALLVVRRFIQETDMLLSLLCAAIIAHLVSWYYILDAGAMDYGLTLSRSLPLLAASLIGMRMSYLPKDEAYFPAPFLYLFSAQMLAILFHIVNPLSIFATGMILLVLSLVYLELARWLDRRYGAHSKRLGIPELHLMVIGYVFLGLFIVGFLVTYLPAETMLGGVKIRHLAEVFLVLGILYWMFFGALEGDKPFTKAIEHVRALFLELLIVALVMIVVVEVGTLYRPMIWSACAIGLFLVRDALPDRYSRLRFYSVVFSWGAALNLAFVTSMYVTPATGVLENKLLTSLVAISLQVIYLFLIHQRSFLVDQHFPAGLSALSRLSDSVAWNINKWVYYPFFLAVFVLIWFAVPEAYLTFFLVMGCFGVFIISIILKENQFRVFSMSALFLSLIRLMLVDLAKSGTLVKAFVFLGIGILMIGMNSLYNKYKDRF